MKNALTIAFLVAATAVGGCGGDKSADKKEPAAAAESTKTTASPQLVALLPAQGEVPGWGVSRAARGFDADTLWELIDGAADGFVSYGVQQVVTADYKQSGSGYQAVLEVYQMKDPLNAFGKYAEERNPASEIVKVGNEGYSGGTSLNFWAGQYYVKITAFEEKDQVKQELAKLGQAVAAKIKDPGAEPVEVSWFPPENQLPRTTLYIPKDVLAQSYFTNGFETKYKAGAKEAKLVVIAMESPEAAKDGLTRYRGTASKDARTITAPGDGGFAGKEGFYGTIAAVRAGKHVAVALGFPTEDAAGRRCSW